MLFPRPLLVRKQENINPNWIRKRVAAHSGDWSHWSRIKEGRRKTLGGPQPLIWRAGAGFNAIKTTTIIIILLLQPLPLYLTNEQAVIGPQGAGGIGDSGNGDGKIHYAITMSGCQ